MLHVLTQKGAELEHIDGKGKKPIVYAIEEKNKAAVLELISLGAGTADYSTDNSIISPKLLYRESFGEDLV